MKQIIFALGFIAIYAVFSFLSNLADMFDGTAIDYQFVGTVHWYIQLKLIMFNCYIYALVSVFLIYTRLPSVPELSLQLEHAMKHRDLTTPITPAVDEDVVIIMYPPSIDPSEHTNNAIVGAVDGIARPSPREGAQRYSESNSLFDPSSSSLPSSHSQSATSILSPRHGSNLGVFPVFGTNISIGSTEDFDIAQGAGIYRAPSVNGDSSSPFHPAMGRSVSAERIDVEELQPTTSMFDIDIVALKRRKAPLERCVSRRRLFALSIAMHSELNVRVSMQHLL